MMKMSEMTDVKPNSVDEKCECFSSAVGKIKVECASPIDSVATWRRRGAEHTLAFWCLRRRFAVQLRVFIESRLASFAAAPIHTRCSFTLLAINCNSTDVRLINSVSATDCYMLTAISRISAFSETSSFSAPRYLPPLTKCAPQRATLSHS